MIYLRCAERLAVLSGFCGATAGRITAGTRYAGSSTTGSASFTERGISYDKAGGMLAIQRYGSNASTPEDNLTLTYNGMTLASVTGTIGGQSVNATFTYDACGRTLTDGVSKLNYQYNLLGALTAVANKNRPIPTGLYNTEVRAEGDFAGDFAFRIYNDNVSIQRGILGHVGNTKKDSTGCILFGMSRRGSYLLNSKVAMSNFRAFFNNKDNIKLIIR